MTTIAQTALVKGLDGPALVTKGYLGTAVILVWPPTDFMTLVITPDYFGGPCTVKRV